MSNNVMDLLTCCKSTDELSDVASTIQAFTSIHFNHEEWIKIRFSLMVYSCFIFMWTIIDSIFSQRTLFYFIYPTHWILLVFAMLYLICSYVITLVIHERIISNKPNSDNNENIAIINNKRDRNQHFEDMNLQNNQNNIPSLSELGLFKWNKFIVFLQNASLSSSIIFPIIFWFIIFPNIGNNHTLYEVLLEFHIHAIIPILIMFDFMFSSRTVLYIDIYQPLIIGVIYCLWTYIIWTDSNSQSSSSANDVDSDSNKTSFLYDRYYFYEINDYILWFILNLSGLCFVHLTFAFTKTKILSNHYMPIQLSTNHTVVIDRNGHIMDSKHKQYDKLKLIKPKSKSKTKPKTKAKIKDKAKNKKSKIKSKHEKKKKSKKEKKKLSAISENEADDMDQKQDDKEDIKHVNDVNDDKKSVDTNNTTKNNNDDDKVKNKDIRLLKANENDKDEIQNNAGNSIQRGFKNLIAMVEPNKNDKKYKRPSSKQNCDTDTESDSDSDSDTDTDTDSVTDSEDDDDHNNHQFKRFYTLKGNDSDMMTTDDENGKFNAIKTKSMAALLNLSKSLHTISTNYKSSGNYKSDIYYSETSGLSDEEAQFGLKSGLYDSKKR